MERYGLKVMSIGFLVEEETPMIWRGPMVQSALVQMLREVAWGELDVLVVDMPPGTGDAQLTMAQQVPLAGAVIVSTPQDLALIDARKGLAMFQRVDVPVLGIVENMSYFLCPHCGERTDIFGHGGAEHEAARIGVPFLGAVPLHVKIREFSDAGTPVVAAEPDGEHARIFRDDRRARLGAGQGRAGGDVASAAEDRDGVSASTEGRLRRKIATATTTARNAATAISANIGVGEDAARERRAGDCREHRAGADLRRAGEAGGRAGDLRLHADRARYRARQREAVGEADQHHRQEERRGLASPTRKSSPGSDGRDEGERRAGEDHARHAEALGEAAGDEIPDHIADRSDAEPQSVDAGREVEHPLRHVGRAAEKGEEDAGRQAAARGEEQEIASVSAAVRNRGTCCRS